MTDAVAKPIKMAIVKNPKKGYIRTPSPEEIKKIRRTRRKIKKRR